MTSRKIWSAVLVLIFLTGCQPARNQKETIRTGRGRGGDSTNLQTNHVTAETANKTWGEVTSNAGDLNFTQTLYYFTLSAVQGMPADDQMGYVSPLSGQATGVHFFGNAVTTGGAVTGTRQFDPNTMMIHFAIVDDKSLANSGSMGPIQIEIGKGLNNDFVQAFGTISGNSQVQLLFQDKSGSIGMQGTVNGTTFSGTVYYCNGAQNVCGNPTLALGQFSVSACGFFQCN